MSISSYKIILQYNGARYFGYQAQKNGTPTVQETLEHTLRQINPNQKVKTIASGRTDAKVHALGQVVKVSMPLKINPPNLLKALNSRLPYDISVKSCEVCSEDFHPIFHAQSKEYHYYFSSERNAFCADLVTLFNYPLDLELMNRGAELFKGEHDFCNYFNVGTEIKSTVRKITKCQLVEVKDRGWLNDFKAPIYRLEIEGNGFLKQMVRLIMGGLFTLGRGKLSLEQVERSLNGRQDKHLALCAPPQGLYLFYVTYP